MDFHWITPSARCCRGHATHSSTRSPNAPLWNAAKTQKHLRPRHPPRVLARATSENGARTSRGNGHECTAKTRGQCPPEWAQWWPRVVSTASLQKQQPRRENEGGSGRNKPGAVSSGTAGRFHNWWRLCGKGPCAGTQSKPSNVKGLSLKSQLGWRRGAPSQAAYCRLLKWAICAIELLLTGLLFHR